MHIVDNSPEMALDDPRIQEVLAGKDGAEPKAKTDDKPKATVSSAAAEPEDKEVDPKDAEIAGLKAELARRKGNADKLEALEGEIKQLRETKSEAKNEFIWIQKLDDDALASKQTDWDDELADARARYARAEEQGDENAMARQGQRVLNAKRHVAAFRKEILDRGRRETAAHEDAKREFTAVQAEIESMQDSVSEAFPDFTDQNSALWKAGNDEYLGHPELMKRLGPLGEIVAAALAVVKHPELVKRDTKNARREVIGSLEKSVKAALSTGASAPSVQRPVNIDVSSGEGLQAFNAMIDKIKGG